jgi:cold shock CspA family protein
MPTGSLKMWNADRGYGFISKAVDGRISVLKTKMVEKDAGSA